MKLTSSQRKTAHKEYTRQNREVWGNLGFRMMSTMVHDDDREEVRCEVECRKYMKMAEMSDADDTPLSTLVTLAQRNMAVAPTASELSGILTGVGNFENEDDIKYAVAQCQEALKKYRGALSNVDRSEDVTKQQRLHAKMVAYGNLATAWMRLAQARKELGQQINVFKGVG